MASIASAFGSNVEKLLKRRLAARGGRARGGGVAPRDTLPDDAVRLPRYKRLTGGAEATP